LLQNKKTCLPGRPHLFRAWHGVDPESSSGQTQGSHSYVNLRGLHVNSMSSTEQVWPATTTKMIHAEIFKITYILPQIIADCRNCRYFLENKFRGYYVYFQGIEVWNWQSLAIHPTIRMEHREALCWTYRRRSLVNNTSYAWYRNW